MQPPEDDEPETDYEAYNRCTHCMACSRLALRLSGETMIGAHRLAGTLGCAECDEYDDGAWMQRRCRERIDALRSECARLLGIVRMAESEGDVCYVNHEFTERLRSLGIEVGDE